MVFYKRIIRPIQGKVNVFWTECTNHKDYCPEKFQLLHAYYLLEKDFKEILDYIEPHDANEKTFSHKIYSLLLRTCTEFETNCKGILLANDYTLGKIPNIQNDYYKINTASKLSDYEIKINIWQWGKIIKPFDDWSNKSYQPLSWYQAYNNVKHNRSIHFSDANLENLLNALAWLYILLCSQFYVSAFSAYQDSVSTTNCDDNNFECLDDNLFSVKFPTNWATSDYITDTRTPIFQNFPF